MSLNSTNIKEIAVSFGAEKCGIASVDRFDDAPEGYRPTDIFEKCTSVIVFLKSMPDGNILARNPVPYSHAANLIYSEIDHIGLKLSRHLQSLGTKAVVVPCDTPYLFWDAPTCHGKGILSMRHAALKAGLGILGRNTLLLNRDLGNMIYIGAILTDLVLESDPIDKSFECPAACRICLDACAQNALDGITVNQKLCREACFAKVGRGFDLYTCNRCRYACPNRLGFQTKMKNPARQFS